MGIQQTNRLNDNVSLNARSCMAIVWVQNGKAFDKKTLIESAKNLMGVSDAKFSRQKPAILMIDYCAKETKAATLVDSLNSMGAYAKIVGC